MFSEDEEGEEERRWKKWTNGGRRWRNEGIETKKIVGDGALVDSVDMQNPMVNFLTKKSTVIKIKKYIEVVVEDHLHQ
jgi:hypothetical protein